MKSTGYKALQTATRNAMNGRTYAGRTVYPSMYETATAYDGMPSAHVGPVIGQNASEKEHTTEVLVVCMDGVARWFVVDECHPVL